MIVKDMVKNTEQINEVDENDKKGTGTSDAQKVAWKN